MRPEATVPEDVERIILQCLAKAPGERLAGAKELRDALVACSVGGMWKESDALAAWDVMAPPRVVVRGPDDATTIVRARDAARSAATPT